MSTVLCCDQLTKSFIGWEKPEGARVRRRTQKVAVDQMTFNVAAGDAVGYIGANGAGKSTTIKMLLGILRPTSGQVTTFGLEPMKHRKAIMRRTGVVFGQRSQLWWDLPVAESFRILAALHRLPKPDAAHRITQLRDRLDMGAFWATPVRKLSLGQRMRAEMGAALVHRPELLVLDEPTIGLDVLSKQQLRDFMLEERREFGTTLLLTTHDLGDIQQLCDRVLLVDQGTLAYSGSLAGLAEASAAHRTVTVDFANPGVDVSGIAHTTVVATRGGGVQVELAVDANHTTAAAVMAEVFRRGDVVDVSIAEPDIEQVVRDSYQK